MEAKFQKQEEEIVKSHKAEEKGRKENEVLSERIKDLEIRLLTVDRAELARQQEKEKKLQEQREKEEK